MRSTKFDEIRAQLQAMRRQMLKFERILDEAQTADAPFREVSPRDRRLARLVEEIKSQPEPLLRKRDLEVLCHRSAISYSHAQRVMRSNYSLSLHEYCVDLALRRAEHMLRESDSSITEIAYDLGFQSPSHFSRIFKQRFNGQSPREYRKRSQKWKARAEKN